MAETTEWLSQGSGAWLCPPGVFEISVECWGAGGIGSPVPANNSVGGGAGGGAYAAKMLNVTPGNYYNYYCAPGPYPYNQYQTDGEDSWFLDTNTVRAAGGKGAGPITSDNIIMTFLYGEGGKAIDSIGDVLYSGGNGSASSQHWEAGAGGGGAGDMMDGGSASGMSQGYGGYNSGGQGGGGVLQLYGGGYGGWGYGGGGGGGSSYGGTGHYIYTSGGQGAEGAILLRYTAVAMGRMFFKTI